MTGLAPVQITLPADAFDATGVSVMRSSMIITTVTTTTTLGTGGRSGTG